MNIKHELSTNPKHNLMMNQPLHSNVSGCDGTKQTQKTSLKAEPFGTFEEVRDYRWCRPHSIDAKLTLNLNKP